MIRPYADDDLDELLDVWHLASLEAHYFLSDEFFDAERKAISEQFLPVSETSVAEIDERIVGFVSVLGNEVGGIFVAPTRQKQGVGRALMDHVLATRPYVELEVFEANVIGRRFYHAYGFRSVGKGFDETTGHPIVRLRIDRSRS